MKHRRLVINLVLLGVAMLGQIAVATATRHGAKPTEFTVRVENISTPDGHEFSFTANPGMKLSMTLMNGQSNDEFYAPDANGIALFDSKGMPVSGDTTDKLILWDAGTEVNEELGIGPNQGPRQKGTNTGPDQHGVVTRAKSEAIYSRNGELFRVTITPKPEM